MDVMEALRAHGEAGAAIVDLLYGDGAAEVSKALSEEGKKKIAAVSNVVGIGAGLQAIPGAVGAVKQARNDVKGVQPGRSLKPVTRIGRAAGAYKRTIMKPKVALGLAAGGLALQAGNVGGDAITNQVLAADRKRTDTSANTAANLNAQRKHGVIKSAEDDIEWFGEFSKMDDDKRQVFGWASVTAVNGQPVKDLQDDEIDLVEIEKAAYDYVKTSRKGGNMHQRDGEEPRHVSDLIESLVVTPEKAKALNINGGHEGWWVGFQVNDDETWADAKDGKLVGFSIHGKGRRAPTE